MKQSRMTSLLKSLVSTAVGFAVAYVANMVILPLFGLPLSHSANVLLTSIYTVISVARGYVLERVFERFGWRVKMSPFASAVLYERNEQTTREGYSIEHDDELRPGVLSDGAMDYAASWMCADASTSRRSLVKAGALILAEGDKFDRSRKSGRESTARTMVWANETRPMTTHKLAHNKTRSEQGGASV